MIRSLREKGFFHLLSVNFLTQSLGFGSILLVAKFLTPIELGEVRILQSYTEILIVLAGLGLNTAVLKYCAEDRPYEEKEHILRAAAGRALITTACALLLFTALALGGAVTSSRRLSWWLLVYALGVVPFAVLTGLLTVFLQALKKIREMARAQVLVRGQLFVIITLCAWLAGFKGFVFATIAAYVVGLMLVLRQVRLRRPAVAFGPVPPHFFSFALFSMLSNAMFLVGQYTDIFILDRYVSDRAEIGYYSLATIFLLGATQVTATAQAIATPYFSERAGDETWFRRRLVQHQTRMSLLSVAVAVAVYALAWVCVPLIYGPSYRSALVYLAILLVKYVVFSSYAILGVALLALGRVRYNFTVVAVSTPAGLILSYVLLRRFGVSGVAWAQVGAALISLGLVMALGRRALRKTFRFAPAASDSPSPPARPLSDDTPEEK